MDKIRVNLCISCKIMHAQPYPAPHNHYKQDAVVAYIWVSMYVY